MEKLKIRIFYGPQICKLINDPNYAKQQNWCRSFYLVQVCLGYQDLLGEPQSRKLWGIDANHANVKTLGANMSLNLHFLHSHLHNFQIIKFIYGLLASLAQARVGEGVGIAWWKWAKPFKTSVRMVVREVRTHYQFEVRDVAAWTTGLSRYSLFRFFVF